tara:strand:+ start:1970 stop:2296 length:327 start_codon:yes stop_codon:yes gene_type:complete
MNKISDIFIYKDDLGKKVYRKVTTYTLEVVQDVLADNEDEAEEKFLEGGGIDYDEIKTSITKENEGVETNYVDANYHDGEPVKLIGKVDYDPDDPDAKEDGFVEVVEV